MKLIDARKAKKKLYPIFKKFALSDVITSKILSALDTSVVEMEQSENNEPLELAKLKQMEGEPVWVHNLEVNKSFWALAYKDVVSNRLGYLDYAGYGQTWIAYRHKQKQQELTGRKPLPVIRSNKN